ncbi:FAD-dependent oxidoreductase [Paraburkholderia kururiensis]|uniref:FAD-dependent oxidoreductase n=1 Tax=Paraburkholderia kururiensis TaxID=984307 RepID=UPI00034DC4FC|nr:FAD-dependent oxidoreductase [Paraburkholderia kururiensis]
MAGRIVSADVCIVGAGPVGLTAAAELASRGWRVALLELRARAQAPSVKSNHISARSMEIFRRLGVADKIRAQGLPDDFPNDGVFATRFTGKELTRFRMPCRRDRFNDDGYDDGNLPSPERAARVSQMYLEPVLMDFVTGMEGVQILNRTSFESFEQSEDSVCVHARSLDDDVQVTINCRFLIGADGGKSSVRKALGFKLEGDDNLTRARSRLIRAPQMLALCGYPKAWMNWFYAGGSWSSAVAIDGRELWLFHCFIPPNMAFEDFDIDKGILDALGVGTDFKYETVYNEDWIGRRLVADRLRDHRVFICGDAAHLWVPYGGYGMNAGIADASNLAWMLDAVLRGWAPMRLLDAHELERKPVTEQVSRFAANFVVNAQVAEAEVIDDDSPAGEEARRAYGVRLREAHLPSWVPSGLNFGYCYADSPIIAHDGAVPPPFTMGSYQPSTTPGSRVPHFWLADGRSLYDALGDRYTLLRFRPDADVTPIVRAAAERGVPLDVLDVHPGKEFDASVYTQAFVLSRPDQHVAWRGETAPEDALALIDRVRGASIEGPEH